MSGFTKSEKHFWILVVFIFNWGAYLYHFRDQSEQPNYQIIKCLPSYFIILFGCFALVSIGKSLWELEDYPEELTKLYDDVKRANQGLQRLAPKIFE